MEPSRLPVPYSITPAIYMARRSSVVTDMATSTRYPGKAQGILTPLYSFGDHADGGYPDYGSVTFGPDGSLFGAASAGGNENSGTLFNVKPPLTTCRITPCGWSNTIVHQFGSGNDGFQPFGKVV